MTKLRDLFLLDPNVVFLNHGSFGACPRLVFDEYQFWQLELERQPVDFIQRRLKNLMLDAREALASYLGADIDEVVYITNATMGINIVARSLTIRAGDEVLTTDHEYGSMNRVWELVCQRQGARYVRSTVGMPAESSGQVVDAIWAGVTNRTKVLFISHITSPSALIFPIEELIKRSREAGIITVIDGAHAAGQLQLNLSQLGADFYVGNCHKWMMAPKGSGFLFARKDMQQMLEPLVGGKSAREDNAPRLPAEHQYQGTRDYAAFLSVPAAVRFMAEHDWTRVRQRCHELLRYARQEVSALTGLQPATPDSPDWFSQMGGLRISPCDGRELKRRLLDEYSIEIPITGWRDQRYVRLSVQGYTTQSDIDRLIEGLATLIPQVATG